MNHSKQTVQTQQNTIASTLFQAEAWKNAFIKLMSEADFEKLDEKDLARLRGDTL